MKIKEFVKKHKKGIAIVSGLGLTALGTVIGYKVCRQSYAGTYIVREPNIVRLLCEVSDFGNANCDYALEAFEESMKWSDLNDWIKTAVDDGLLDDKGYTHFLALRKTIKS